MKRLYVALHTLVFVALIAGCAALQPAPTGVEVDYDQRAAELRALSQWEVSGRAAIRTAEDSGTVSMDWRQLGERYRVELRAPWGAGTVRVDGGPGAVMLRTGEGEEVFAEEPGALLAYYTGYDLPLASLRYWLLGVPDPEGEAELELDANGWPTRLIQHGWEIVYRRYGVYDGRTLPRTLFMNDGEVEVRVAIHAWSVSE